VGGGKVMASIQASFSIGRKLFIRNYEKVPDYWSEKMKKYMGKEVTVKSIGLNSKTSMPKFIKIEEDQKEVPGGWQWSPYNFIER